VALVPAVLGLWGNASFSQAVPVRVPSSATSSQPAASHDESSRHDPLDDRSVDARRHHDRLDDSRATRTPDSATEIRDDRGREGSGPETGDDRGGNRAGSEVESDHHSGGDDGTEHSGSNRDRGGDDHGGDSIGHASDG
jgi:hypothetical protein